MKKILLICIITFAFNYASAQETKNNVVGWGKAVWGMNEEDLIKTFPDAIKLEKPELVLHSDGTFVSIIIPNYKVGKQNFKVSFQMRPNTKTLSNILMELNDTPLNAIFDSITNLLIEKYGEPKNKTESEYNKVILWVYPKTKITLTRIVMKDLYLDKLRILYSQREGDESAKF